MASAVNAANPNAEVARRGQVMEVNVTAAAALQNYLKGSLGPKGTMKM